jgi:hypothetical protein
LCLIVSRACLGKWSGVRFEANVTPRGTLQCCCNLPSLGSSRQQQQQQQQQQQAADVPGRAYPQRAERIHRPLSRPGTSAGPPCRTQACAHTPTSAVACATSLRYLHLHRHPSHLPARANTRNKSRAQHAPFGKLSRGNPSVGCDQVTAAAAAILCCTVLYCAILWCVPVLQHGTIGAYRYVVVLCVAMEPPFVLR